MKGLHLIADFHDCNCPEALLTDAARLETWCIDACTTCSLEVVASAFHQFPAGPKGVGGATGAVVLAESHLAIHTWPELGCVTLDLYVCNFSRDNRTHAEALLSRLARELRPTHQEVIRLERGSLNRASTP